MFIFKINAKMMGLLLVVIFLAILLYKSSPWGREIEGKVEYYRAIDTLATIENDTHPFLFMPKAPVFTFNDTRMYITDVGNCRILQLNKKLKLIKEFGSNGQGPGEFLRPNALKIKDNKIFISDIGTNLISVFDTSGNFLSSFRCPFRIWDFAVGTNELIYTPSCSKGSLVTVFDIKGKEILSFGKLIEESDSRLSELLSIAYIEIDEYDNIYVAFVQSPFIRKYSASGKLIWENNLLQYSELKKIFTKAEERRKKQRYNIFSMCIGTDLKQDILYVGYIGVIPFGNTVYCFSKKDGTLKKVLRISHGFVPLEKLPDAWDISVSYNGDLWLAEWKNARILRFIREKE